MVKSAPRLRRKNSTHSISGLLGVSCITGDMRKLSASKDPYAAEAIRRFVYRIGRELGSLVAALEIATPSGCTMLSEQYVQIALGERVVIVGAPRNR